jgi:hypothetical protein
LSNLGNDLLRRLRIDDDHIGWIAGEHPDGNGVAIGQLDWRALEAPEISPNLATQGFRAVAICGSNFGSFLRAQYDEYGRVIREANIKE